MTMQAKNHNIEDELELEFSYINECCKYCGKEFTNIKDVLVGIDNDEYLCEECSIELDIITCPCREL